MAQIKYMDTDGDKSRILPKGSFGMDDYPAGNDVGRVYISTGAENIPLAKKIETDQLKLNVEEVSANALAFAVALG